ncbi:hypothetical protein E4U14_006539 [Claviceps sp. LM454 group G7]|nr:hypothetical protein E4U14_006539 [Claviceps sp. LM454 group G7]
MCAARSRNRRAAERAATTAAETSTTHSVSLPPSRTCTGCSKRRPVTDFSLKDPLGDADGERYLVCAPCTVKRNIRRPLKRNIEQVDQQDDEPPPARRQRLPTLPTEAAGAAGTEETTAIAICGWCSGCMRWLPLPDFPRRSDGARARQCERCKEHPEQVGEQDADGQDDGPPPASPRQETPAVDSVRQQKRLPPTRRQTAPHIDQENIAPPPVRRARRSKAQLNADRAAEDRRRTAKVKEAMAAALRSAEANAQRTSERADAARAAEAEFEAARRALTASQEARRAAVLQESMAAAAEEARRAAGEPASRGRGCGCDPRSWQAGRGSGKPPAGVEPDAIQSFCRQWPVHGAALPAAQSARRARLEFRHVAFRPREKEVGGSDSGP